MKAGPRPESQDDVGVPFTTERERGLENGIKYADTCSQLAAAAVTFNVGQTQLGGKREEERQ